MLVKGETMTLSEYVETIVASLDEGLIEIDDAVNLFRKALNERKTP